MDISNNFNHLLAWHIEAICEPSADDIEEMRNRLVNLMDALMEDNPEAAVNRVIEEEFANA